MDKKVVAILSTGGKRLTLNSREFNDMPVTYRLEHLRSKAIRFYEGDRELSVRDGIRAMSKHVRDSVHSRGLLPTG